MLNLPCFRIIEITAMVHIIFLIAAEKTFQEHINKYDVTCLNMQQFLMEPGNQRVTDYPKQEVPEGLETVPRFF